MSEIHDQQQQDEANHYREEEKLFIWFIIKTLALFCHHLSSFIFIFESLSFSLFLLFSSDCSVAPFIYCLNNILFAHIVFFKFSLSSFSYMSQSSIR